MLKLNLVGVGFVLVFLPVGLGAQELRPLRGPADKLPDMVRAHEAFYSRTGMGRGSGFRQFKRWQHLFAPRSYPSGNLVNITALAWVNHFHAARSPEFAAGKAAAVAAGIGTSNWHSIGPAGSMTQAGGGDIGRINAIAFHPSDPQTLYAGTPAAGLWRSQDDGVNWTGLTDGLPLPGISDIAIDPLKPATIYVLSGDGEGGVAMHGPPSVGVLKSMDAGRTWNPTGLVFKVNQSEYGHRLAIHPSQPNVLLAATSAGMFRTQDGGDAWIRVIPGTAREPLWDVLFHPTVPSIVYAASSSIVYRSDDAGLTWMRLAQGLPQGPPSVRIRLGVSPASPNTLYVLYGATNGFTVGLYRSDDGGRHFTKQSNSNPRIDLTTPNILGYKANDNHSQADYDLALAVSPTNIERVNVGALDSWRSDDAGRTWKQTSYWDKRASAPDYAHADFHVMAYRGGALYAGNDGGIYKSNDGGDSWASITNMRTGMNIAQTYSVCATPADPDLLFYGAQDNGTYRLSLDGQVTLAFGGDGGICLIDPRDSNIVYASYVYGEFFRSDQGGRNGSFVPRNPNVSGPWITPILLHPADPDILFACYADLWRSPDRGFEWKNLSNGALGPSVECRQVAVAPSDPNTIYVAKQASWPSRYSGDARPAFFGGGGVFRSTDAGATWESITGTLPMADAAITNLAVSPTDARRVWVTFSGYHTQAKVFGSTDGGATWSNLSAGLANLPVNAIAAASGPAHGVYVGLDVGVYYRDDRLDRWVAFMDGLPDVIVNSLVLDEKHHRLLAATFGRGVWMTDFVAPCTEHCGSPVRPLLVAPRREINAAPASAAVPYEGRIDVFE